MNHGSMQFYSVALGRNVNYEVILPEREVGPGPFPVLFQLHGLSDNRSGIVHYSTLSLKARLLPLIVVIPEGGLAHWANIGPRERYESFLVEDLWEHVHRTFAVRPGPGAISGHSRGGNGAVRLALKHPHLFCSAVSHSGAFYYPEEVTDLPEPEALAQYDIWQVKPTGAHPAVSLDCGLADQFIEHNRAFSRHLTQLGVAHQYAEYPGGHTWDYWNERLDATLAFHLANLEAAR